MTLKTQTFKGWGVILDDSKIMGVHLKELLEKTLRGIEVQAVSSGAQLLSACHNSLSEEWPRFILIDVILGSSETGFSWATLAQNIFADAEGRPPAIVLMTQGQLAVKDSAEAQRLGFTVFVKPTPRTERDFIEALKKLL